VSDVTRVQAVGRESRGQHDQFDHDRAQGVGEGSTRREGSNACPGGLFQAAAHSGLDVQEVLRAQFRIVFQEVRPGQPGFAGQSPFKRLSAEVAGFPLTVPARTLAGWQAAGSATDGPVLVGDQAAPFGLDHESLQAFGQGRIVDLRDQTLDPVPGARVQNNPVPRVGLLVARTGRSLERLDASDTAAHTAQRRVPQEGIQSVQDGLLVEQDLLRPGWA